MRCVLRKQKKRKNGLRWYAVGMQACMEWHPCSMRCRKAHPGCELEVIPGITAANSGGGGAWSTTKPRLLRHQLK